MKLACGLVILLALAAVATSGQQGTPLKSCPLIDLADAALVTGKGVDFQSGLEIDGPGAGERTCVCFFGVGYKKTLTVKIAPTLGRDAAAYREMMAPRLRIDGGTPEPGLGEYAFSKLKDDTALLTVVKGSTALTLEYKAKKVESADLEHLRGAARTALEKL